MPHNTGGGEGDAVAGQAHSLVVDGVDRHIGDLCTDLQHVRRGICGHNYISAIKASGFGLNHHFGGFLGVRDGCCYRNRNRGSFDILEDRNSAGADCLQEGTLKVDHNSSGFIRMCYPCGAHLKHEVIQNTGQLVAQTDVTHLLVIWIDNPC